MSGVLNLSIAEYDRMIACGAFDQLNRKIELIRGTIREMNPAGPMHDDLIVYLNNWSVRASDPRTIRVCVQTGLGLDELSSRPEPDLMWVRAARYRAKHPGASNVRLAIEVADSSLNYDLFEKSALYAEAGVIEYWIVDARSQCIHVFQEPRNGEYNKRNVYKTGESLSPLEPCITPLNLQDLFGNEP